MNYRYEWANGNIEAGTLLDAIDQLRAELAASKFCANVADDFRAELAAIKGQEPVAWRTPSGGLFDRKEVAETGFRGHICKVTPLYAAPVPSAVVMPDVPSIQFMARFLSDKSADVLGHSRESTWVGHGDHFIEIVTEMVAASHVFDESKERALANKFIEAQQSRLAKGGHSPLTGIEESAMRGAWLACAKSRALLAGGCKVSVVDRYVSTRMLPSASGWNRSAAPHTYVRASDYDRDTQALKDELEHAEQWRSMALQFDGHRMRAMALLRMIGTDVCQAFLAEPPISALEITAANQRLEGEVGDLSMLVRQLVQALRKAAPDHGLPEKALDYLKRKGLHGSPLRAALSTAVKECLTVELVENSTYGGLHIKEWHNHGLSAGRHKLYTAPPSPDAELVELLQAVRAEYKAAGCL